MGYFDFPHTRSYDTDLGFLIKMFLDMKKRLEVLENADNEYNQKLQEEIAKLKKYIDDFILRYQSNIDRLDDEDKKIYEYINSIHDLIDSRIDVLINRYDNHIENIYIYIDTQLKEVISNLLKYIDDSQKMAFIDNPTTGKLDTVGKTVNDVYEWLRYGALTAVEYDVIAVTAGQYDRIAQTGSLLRDTIKFMTAREYDIWGRLWLAKTRVWGYMRNELNGLVEQAQKVYGDLFAYINHQTNITASEYEQLNMSAETYDSKAITAYEYSINGHALLLQ